MPVYTIKFLPDDRIVTVKEGDNLLEIAMKADVYINASCGGNGTCGKCRVRVMEGETRAPMHPKVSREDYDAGVRLACMTTVHGETVVEIPPESRVDRAALRRKREISPVLSSSGGTDLIQGWEVNPAVSKRYIELQRPSIDDNVSDLRRLEREFQAKYGRTDISIDFPVLKTLNTTLRDADWKVTVTVIETGRGIEIVNVEPGNTGDRNYSIVIDVGTTTISAQILDLANCSVVKIAGRRENGLDLCTLAESSDYNSQIRYGEDVISRIMYAQKSGGLERLQKAVVKTINGLISELLGMGNIEAEDITHIVCAGNTTMTHLLLGISPKYIMLAPYTPVMTSGVSGFAASGGAAGSGGTSLASKGNAADPGASGIVIPPVRAKEIGITLNGHARVFAFPCVSSYVGGDIVAGMIGSGMFRKENVSLYMDIGTNGEVVLGNKDWLMCVSCSAGPAFEGGGIKFGMRAGKGAIEQVKIHPVTYEPMVLTIGKAKPAGICGSGLIDIVAGLIETGLIDQNGKFRRDRDTVRVRHGEDGYEYVICYASESRIDRDIIITEVDIDNLVRTKAAIYAGCVVLLEHAGISYGELEQVIIAGGFGHYIDVERAQVIGLLPELPPERFVFVGNGSLLGARLFSFSKGFLNEAERVARNMTNIELSNSKSFMDGFVAAMFLPHTDQNLFPGVMERLKNSG
jgi:uncharacterized 2Fe-2S/4Fe-4S cluster protein (DUF4445 family)